MLQHGSYARGRTAPDQALPPAGIAALVVGALAWLGPVATGLCFALIRGRLTRRARGFIFAGRSRHDRN